MTRYFPFIVIIGSLFLGIAFAQDVQNISAPTMTLVQAESLAMAQNPDVISAWTEYRQAGTDLLSAWSLFLPSASLSGGWTRYNREMLSFRNDSLIFSRDRYSFSLSARYPLFAGGQDYLTIKQTKLAYDIALLSFEDSRAQTRSVVYAAYFALVQAIKQSIIAQHSLDRALEEEEITVQKRNLGSASDVDVSKMKVQVAQKKLSDIEAKNAVHGAREQLCQILNFPLDSSFMVDTTQVPPPVEDISSLMNYLNQFENNRNIRQANIGVRSSRLARLSSWLEYVPALDFSAGWSWSGYEFPDNSTPFADEASSSYGISLSWTILSGTSRIANIKKSAITLEQSELTLNTTKVSIEQQIRSAHREMVESAASYELSVAQVEDAQLTLNATRKRYEIGSATLLELLDTELLLEQSQLQGIATITEFYTQQANIEWLIGQ